MRTFLVTGPGGAGTTTSAVAVAVRAARGGRRTTLVCRGLPPVPLGHVAGLTVAIVDPQAGAERHWASHVATLGALVPQLDLPPAGAVLSLPGAGELTALAELAGADADLAVLDAGPLDAALALLALPGALRWWLGQLLPARLRALAALGAAGGAAAALAALPALERLLDSSPLSDPADVDVCLTAVPRAGTPAALRGAATALALHGLSPATVLARVLPRADGPWATARLAEQDAVLAELGAVAPVGAVPELPVAPRDADGVAALLDGTTSPDVFSDASPEVAAMGSRPVPPEPVRTGAGWDLVIPLSFAERGAVELTRVEDDLVLTAAGARRSFRLDPLLRRCSVTGGRLADPGTAAARLVVGFEPDPRQWPAGLLDAHRRSA